MADIDKLFEIEKVAFEADKAKSFKNKVFENIDVIKRRIIEKYMVLSQYYLVDFNWNVNVFILLDFLLNSPYFPLNFLLIFHLFSFKFSFDFS